MVLYPAFNCYTDSWDKLYSLFFISFLAIIMFGVNVLSVRAITDDAPCSQTHNHIHRSIIHCHNSKAYSVS